MQPFPAALQSRPRRTCALLRVVAASFLVAWTPGGGPLRAAGPMDPLPREDALRIAQALPARAPAIPAKPRRLLIYVGNVNYGGHRSMAHAAEAFRLMGETTGAFTTQVSADPADFSRERLASFDAVFLNNNVGNLFEDAALRQSLLEFILAGGGLMAVHGSSVAFTRWPGAVEDWPEFGRLLGGRGANHRESDEHVVLKLDSPEHPVNAVFAGQPFDLRDEIFRVHEPYSRERVRVLFSIDTARTDMNQGPPRGDCVRADNDYAVAWVRGYGRGRTFYCTVAHNPYVFWEPRLLQFYLAAAQFVLGDLPGPVIPSARVTPAVLAQERLGWRPAGALWVGGQPLLEAAAQTPAARRTYATARLGQPLGDGLPGTLSPDLDEATLSRLRLKLDDYGVRVLSLRIDPAPAEAAAWRRLFVLARKLGIETLVTPPAPSVFDLTHALRQEFKVGLAVSVSEAHACRQALAAAKGPDPLAGVCLEFDTRERSDLTPDLIRSARGSLVCLRVTASGGLPADCLAVLVRRAESPAFFELAAADADGWAALEASSLHWAGETANGRKP